ncbi:hypothetical protein [Salinicoccus albus]|uniref:hypothetical protein n=1 Tax=Salinicoccus albus TaxID=418756 RepID=UPI001FE150B8|nr:hypothetical protein [Salinicoccus albus]
MEAVINFGLKKYVITENTVETTMTRVITNGRKSESKSIKYSVMTPSRILKLLSASLIGTKNIIIPNNEGIKNFNNPFVVIELLSGFFLESFKTLIPILF